MMCSGGGTTDDPLGEVLGLIDEFDSADLSDITQRTAGIEWPRSQRDYKEMYKMIKKRSRKISNELREKDQAIHESQVEESSFKEKNTSLKRKINRTHSEVESISGELKDLNGIDRELNEAIETRKMPLEEREHDYYTLMFSTAFARKKRLSDLLNLRRKKMIVAMDSRNNTIKYISFDAKKILTARNSNESTNGIGILNNSVHSQGNYEEWGKVNDGSGNNDAITNVSEMECE